MGKIRGFEGVGGFTVASSAVWCCRHPVRWTMLVLRVLGTGRHRMVLVQLLLWILSCRFTLFCMQLFADISGTSSLALSDSMSTAAVSTFLNTALWFAVLTCDKVVAEFGEPALRKGSVADSISGRAGAPWSQSSLDTVTQPWNRISNKAKLGPFLLTEFWWGECLLSAEAPFFSPEWKKTPKTKNC